jgi:hypothetical protein
MRKIKIISAMMFIAVSGSIAQSRAQDTTEVLPPETVQQTTVNQPESHFMVVGLTTFGFMNEAVTNSLGGMKSTSKYNTLGDADRYEFSPMFLWRHGDNMLLEFEPSFDGTNLGVNWADVAYFVKPGLIIKGGYLVLPFGTYTKRLAAGWIDKLPSDPIGTDVAGSDFGIEVEGGLPLGNMKWSYDVSISNGFQLNNDGTISGVGISAVNNGKTVCGRLALLPIPNSSLEVGVSGLYGALATPPGATFTNTSPTDSKGPMVTMYAVDLNYVKTLSPVQLNVKAQYSATMVNSVNYQNPNDSTQNYSFTNTITAAFGQVSARPVQAKGIVRNMELAYRYVDYKTPQNSTWGQNYTESDIALDYWLSWRTVLKAGYEMIRADGTSSVPITGVQGSTNINRLIIQFSTEF